MAARTVKNPKPKAKAKSKTPKAKKVVKKGAWESRATLRLIEAGSSADCPFCNEQVSYKARLREMQVICNVYEDNVWQRVEQFHQQCYKDAKNPYGKAKKKKSVKRPPKKPVKK